LTGIKTLETVQGQEPFFRVIKGEELAGGQYTVRTVHSRAIEAPLFGGVADRICGAHSSDVFFRHHQSWVT
jgi:hypothetical protein